MTKKVKKVVYSGRVSEEIVARFKEECERLGVPNNYVVSEFMKQFIVKNAGLENHETAVISLYSGEKTTDEDIEEILE